LNSTDQSDSTTQILGNNLRVGGRKCHGYSSVKQEQREAVRCVLLGRDCFVTVPTGFGKPSLTLCHLYASTKNSAIIRLLRPQITGY